MSRRIDIELTSRKDDSSWTWRAVGAREPKGVLRSSLLPAGVQVGAVLRAEIEQSIDGIDVLSVSSAESKRAARDADGRIEVLGRPVREESLVTTVLAAKGRGGGRGHRNGPGGDRDRTESRGRTRGPSDSDRSRAPKGGGRGSSGGETSGGQGHSPDRGARGSRERPDRPRRQFTPPPPLPERPKAKRLRPLRAHRSEVVGLLPEEQRPVAEQVLLGGIPAVRRAIEQQNEEAKKQGGQAIEAKGVVGLAESLLPRLREAEWLDRADAALKVLDELDLRDLRSVVAAAELGARSDEARKQADELRAGLERRVNEEHSLWLEEIAELVSVGRVARALRVAGRPPRAGSPLPDDLAGQLIAAAAAAMTTDTNQERYATIIDAAAISPVRTRIRPQGVPLEPSAELLKAVRRYALKVPAVAAAFGLEPDAVRPPQPPTARIPAPPVMAVAVGAGTPDPPEAPSPGGAGTPDPPEAPAPS